MMLEAFDPKSPEKMRTPGAVKRSPPAVKLETVSTQGSPTACQAPTQTHFPLINSFHKR
jgi:hypothetical protein